MTIQLSYFCMFLNNPLKVFCENDWFHAWYIVAIPQLLTELSILRPEQRFKLQKILSDASIKNEVLNHIKVNGMH